MNKAMLSVGIIFLAVLALLLINVLNNYATGGELDYYLVKETTEAAMQDSLDINFQALNGVVRMDKEKFVESFIRRFANNINDTREYKITFYSLNEVPPKVTIKVDSLTTLSFDGDAAEITTSISELVQSNTTTNDYLKAHFQNKYSAIGKPIALVKQDGVYKVVRNEEIINRVD